MPFNALYSALALSALVFFVQSQQSDYNDPSLACYVPGGACQIQYDFDTCDTKYNASSFTAYDTCNCESGYVSLVQACENCQAAAGEEVDSFAASSSSICSSLGVTIGLVPLASSTVQLANSSFSVVTPSSTSFLSTVGGGPTSFYATAGGVLTESLPSIPIVSATSSSRASASWKRKSLGRLFWREWSMAVALLYLA